MDKVNRRRWIRFKKTGTWHQAENRILNAALSLLWQTGYAQPLMVLSRGYSITRDMKEQIIKSVRELHEGDELEIILSDGTVRCATNKIAAAET